MHGWDSEHGDWCNSVSCNDYYSFEHDCNLALKWSFTKHVIKLTFFVGQLVLLPALYCCLVFKQKSIANFFVEWVKIIFFYPLLVWSNVLRKATNFLSADKFLWNSKFSSGNSGFASFWAAELDLCVNNGDHCTDD